MLKFFRKRKIKKIIYHLLAIIIVPAFILWGSAVAIKDKQTKGYAGKIFGKKISHQEYISELYTWRNKMKMQFGDKASQIENLLDPNRAVWDRLILLFEARKIKVTDSELTEHITSLPFLQRDGVFNPELYTLFLEYSLNTPVHVFEEQTREDLKIKKLYEQVTAYVQVSEDEIKEKYRKEYSQIKASYVYVLTKDSENEVKLTEEDLKNYYETHKAEYAVPIQINLSYAGIDFTDDKGDKQQEEINEKIKQVHKLIVESKDFFKAKDQFGLEVKETGLFALGDDIPGFRQISIDAEELFNLNQNQISDIVTADRGLYIFQLKEKVIDAVKSFEEVKDMIRENLLKQKTQELAKSKIDDYYSKINAKKQENPNLTLSQIANQLSLNVKETDFFSRSAPIKDTEVPSALTSVALSLADNEISQVIQFSQWYFITNIAERKPIDEEDLQKQRDKLKQHLLEEKKNQAFEEYFEELKNRAKLVDYIASQQNQKQPLPIPSTSN